MKHKTSKRSSSRSNKSYCLLCSSKLGGGKLSEGCQIIGDTKGQEKCVGLKVQLEKMFILLKVLDVPASWCEEKLRGGGLWDDIRCEDTSEDGVGPPGSWFEVCSNCLEGKVNTAWKLHQKILVLEARMASLKEEVKEGMRREIIKDNLKKIYHVKEGNTDSEIKKFLFPDLFVKCEVLVVENNDLDSLENDIDMSFSDNEDDDPTFKLTSSTHDGDASMTKNPSIKKPAQRLNSEENNTTKGRKHTLTPKKRGRPPKKRDNEEPEPPKKRGRRPIPKEKHKPGFRHPLYYYAPNWGTLREKKFHWKVCLECDSRYKSQEEYDAHQKAHEDVKVNGSEFICPKCSFPARTAQELTIHEERRHMTREGYRKEKYKCPKCVFETGVWKILKMHVDSDHPTVTPEEWGSEISLKCELCGKQTNSMPALSRHMNSKHPERDSFTANGSPRTILQCPHCPIKFPSQRLLRQHIKNTHERNSRFVCEECGKGFIHESVLRDHKLRHIDKSKQGDFICHLCGLDFYREKLLAAHVRKAHKNPPSTSSAELFKCRFCEVTSPFKFFIKRHLESHKEALGIRCEQCGKLYTNEQALKRHIKLNHSGDGPWPCPFCGKEYPCEEYMKDHVKKYCRVKELQEEGANGGEEQKALEKKEMVEETQSIELQLLPSQVISDSQFCNNVEIVWKN